MSKKSKVTNAPSKTGKPSGKGRGNAPTKPSKTSPPQLKRSRK